MASTTKYKQKSDEEIVLLIINSGNQELFELIYSRYFKKVQGQMLQFFKRFQII